MVVRNIPIGNFIKVQSALPAIDTNPPVYRGHVAVKLKKQQRENERCKKIERDNYLLLQKMSYIMRTSRVDNVWRTPQPNFLNKIAIYDSIVPEIEDISNYDLQLMGNENELRNRKSSCYACRSRKFEETKAPEENIPQQHAKKLITRIRSKSVPARKSDPLPLIKEQPFSEKSNSCKLSDKAKINSSKTINSQHKIHKEIKAKEPHSIMLSRGCLKLAVNFPSDTMVKLENGNIEKILMNGFCHCKNSCKPIGVY